MPLIQVSMVEGRDAQQQEALIGRLTDAAVETLGVRRETVRVLIYELAPQHWAIGGRSKQEEAR